jgi:hypothetical protein
MPGEWLVTGAYGHLHTLPGRPGKHRADAVRTGRIRQNEAVRILTTSVRDLFTGPDQREPGRPA